MAPTAAQTEVLLQTPKFLHFPNKIEVHPVSTKDHVPLQLSGALDQWEQHDLTPLMGTEFGDINLTEILLSPSCDQIIRDIAITSKYTSAILFKICFPQSHIHPLSLIVGFLFP